MEHLIRIGNGCADAGCAASHCRAHGRDDDHRDPDLDGHPDLPERHPRGPRNRVLKNNLFTMRTVIDNYTYDKQKAPQTPAGPGDRRLSEGSPMIR